MSKTRAELINQVLDRLQILVYGQSASDEDIQKADRLVDGAIAQLSALDIYYVQDPGTLGPSDGAIEDEAFLALADYIAQFHLLADARMQALAAIAESNLRILAAPARTLRTLRVDPALTPRRVGIYRGGLY
jgi:hypothetical protein